MLDKVKKTISDNNMISENDKVLVALSGGCDSVCLCLVLKELDIDFSVAHLNHSIREEADSDQEFCENFATKLGVDFYSKKIDIPLVAKQKGISEEVAGRNARYEFFDNLCKEKDFSKIAVAHNLNDNAETVLLNLLRGSGLKGLCGIPKTRDNIIRPLIDVLREEIEEFVKSKNQDFVTDKTNFSDDYTRNKIRNNVINKLVEINPSALSNISKTTEILTDHDMYFETLAEKYVYFDDKCAYIKISEFETLEPSVKARVLSKAYTYAAKTSKDFEKKHIEYIINNYNKISGEIIHLCFDVVCRSEYGNIVFQKKTEKKDYIYTLPLNKEVYVKEAGIKFLAEIVSRTEMKKSKDAEFFDVSLAEKEIKIRSRQEGDRMVPFGRKTPVKVKDVLIKNKIPQTERNTIPVIETDEILWLYGVKRADKYKISENSDKVLKIKGEKTNVK